MRLNEILSKQYQEIEFVCVNPDYCDATDPKAQEALWNDLKKVQGIVAYTQDWSHEWEGNKSLAVIIKNPEAKETIKALAKKHGVGIDTEVNNVRDETYLTDLSKGNVEAVTATIFNEVWGVPIPSTTRPQGLKKVTKKSYGKIRTYYEPIDPKRFNEKKRK